MKIILEIDNQDVEEINDFINNTDLGVNQPTLEILNTIVENADKKHFEEMNYKKGL